MELFVIALVVGLVLIVVPLVVKAVVPRVVTPVTPTGVDGAPEGQAAHGETQVRDRESA